MPPKRAPSTTPVPSTEANPERESAAAANDGPVLPDAEWDAMQAILDVVYDYRTPDGYDPSKVFHRKVNKRAIPAYYEVIKEPVALSTIKARINGREYKHFSDFVRDFALIPHNAQVYNRPDAGAYQDALVIRGLLETELRKLVDQKLIPEEVAKLPYLGEIPPQDELPVEDEDEDEDEDDDDDDEGEEGDDSEEDGNGNSQVAGKKKRRRGRPSKKDREADRAEDPEMRKKRGRPPKVLTPTEARIQAVLKGLRKPKNDLNQLKIGHFERLPDKAVMPEYFNEIRNPMAYDMLKRKLKRKKYQSLEQFMKDVELMFENAKAYNEDESQIYQDAVSLQTEAQRLADEERSKPDSEYVMEEGRIPLPNGILHNGELYKVGDWVHIQNPNDLTKPIPTQIYRTWQASDGGQWVNVCWYYRPEQTVHRFDKHFLENELVKTGQYRDHRIDEIVDRCFIMFVTRYYKGRPRALPRDMHVYVCQARYNEEKFKFNKIKTWASCLPDEVRDKDYEMDLFDAPRRMKKNPSPLAYLLKDDQKETDQMPKPEWGAENAPPRIGAVHRRPRDPQDSPPPEPTPPPPPPEATPVPATAPTPTAAPVPVNAHVAPASRQASHMSPQPPPMSYSPMTHANTVGPPPPTTTPAPVARQPSISRASHTPAAHPQQYVPQHSASPVPTYQRAPSSQTPSFPPATPQQNPPIPMPRTLSQTSNYPPQIPPPPSVSYLNPPRSASSSYRDPPPIEVYTLPETANASIPPEIREQFECDEHDRVLFFTTPPVQLSNDQDSSANLSHSIGYLATRTRSEDGVAKKRKAYEAAKADAQAAKKKRRMAEAEAARTKIEHLKQQALEVLQEQLVRDLVAEKKEVYGDAWEVSLDQELERLGRAQQVAIAQRRAVEAHERERALRATVQFRAGGTLADE